MWLVVWQWRGASWLDKDIAESKKFTQNYHFTLNASRHMRKIPSTPFFFFNHTNPNPVPSSSSSSSHSLKQYNRISSGDL
jgi:hypothetical protein